MIRPNTNAYINVHRFVTEGIKKKLYTEVPHFLHKWDKITENILTSFLDYAANL